MENIKIMPRPREPDNTTEAQTHRYHSRGQHTKKIRIDMVTPVYKSPRYEKQGTTTEDRSRIKSEPRRPYGKRRKNEQKRQEGQGLPGKPHLASC